MSLTGWLTFAAVVAVLFAAVSVRIWRTSELERRERSRRERLIRRAERAWDEREPDQ